MKEKRIKRGGIHTKELHRPCSKIPTHNVLGRRGGIVMLSSTGKNIKYAMPCKGMRSKRKIASQPASLNRLASGK
jgi:hypothetical protein